MLFLANVKRSEFGRKLDEKRKFQLEGDDLQRVLRRARNEPNKKYVIQRKETLFNDLKLVSGSGKSVSLFLTGFVHKDESIRCYFANSKFRSLNSTIGLNDLCIILRESAVCVAYIFLSIDGDCDRVSKSVLEIQGCEIFICIMANKWERLCALLATETASWDGKRSLNKSEITHKYVGHLLERFIYRLTEEFTDMVAHKDWETFNKISTNEIAWPQIATAYTGVDENKLIHGRKEQILDELNRLAQAAADREHSAQASFWFAELEDYTQKLYNHLPRHMLIFADAFGDQVDDFIYSSRILNKSDPGIDALREFLSKFVKIPSGNFIMGKDALDSESEPPASPQHIVWLDEFSIMKSPITNSEWQMFAPNHIVYRSSQPTHPVVNVSFLEAMDMANHLTGLLKNYDLIETNFAIKLPSEAQWEKSARGTNGQEYPWGDVYNNRLCNVASTGLGETSPVGSFSPQGDSPYGCQDMIGNVREWTSSFGGDSIRSHNLYPYDASTDIQINTMRPELQMIIRGASFSYGDICVKAWVRNKEISFRKRGDTGVRFIIVKSRNSM